MVTDPWNGDHKVVDSRRKQITQMIPWNGDTTSTAKIQGECEFKGLAHS